jgi:hypothetical protein
MRHSALARAIDSDAPALHPIRRVVSVTQAGEGRKTKKPDLFRDRAFSF